MNRRWPLSGSYLLAALAFVLSFQSSASAQLSKVGSTIPAITNAVRGNDTAYDPVNDVYLVVGAHGVTRGVFVNGSGVAITAPFAVSTSSAHFSQFPRVEYSADVNGSGGFLVTWHQNDGTASTNVVHGRLVSFGAVPTFGTDRVIGVVPNGTWWEAAPAIAYSATSQVFLVTWQASGSSIWGVRVGTNGVPVGSPFMISTGGGRDPGVAWNPETNEFGVSYSGWDATSPTVSFARVRASDGAILRRTLVHRSGGAFITDIIYNPARGTFIQAFVSAGNRTAEINAAGDVVNNNVGTSAVGTYDGLALAFNPLSISTLMVGHHPSAEVGAVELNGAGALASSVIAATSSGGVGAFYPRAVGNTVRRHWDVTFSAAFTKLMDQVVATTTVDGSSGGGGALPPPPPPPTGCTTPQPVSGWVCVNGGWVPPTTSGGSGGSGGGGSTGGCTTPQPVTGWVCVNGGWVPPTSSGGGGSTSGCSTPQPATGWVCVNGGWVPPTSSGGGGSTSGCTTPQPVTGWVCVNGGWVPPTTSGGSSGGSTGGCTTPDPFVVLGGGTCVNGGWRPPGSVELKRLETFGPKTEPVHVAGLDLPRWPALRPESRLSIRS